MSLACYKTMSGSIACCTLLFYPAITGFENKLDLFAWLRFTKLSCAFQLYAQTAENSPERQLLIDTWGWRELLQRGIDGYDTTDDASAAGLAEYEELPGAMPPVSGGYQVIFSKLFNNTKTSLNQKVLGRHIWFK